MYDAVDGDLELRLDPKQAWSSENAVQFAAYLEAEEIYLQFLEQPIRIDSVGDVAHAS